MNPGTSRTTTDPRPVNLADIMEMMAETIPDRPAVITIDGEYTYSQVDERATRLANHLVSVGIKPGDHVAVHAMNCIEWVEAFYGITKARAVPINVNYRYVHRELIHIYENSGAVMAIVAPEYVEALEEVRSAVPTLAQKLVLGEEYDAALAAASPRRQIGERTADDRYIIYTGGTTGFPKGVLWRQEDIVRAAMNALRFGAPFESVEQVAAEAAANENPMRLCTAGPLMHGGSQWIMGNCHVAGATFVLYTQRSFDPEAMLDLVEKARATTMVTLGDAMGRPLAEAILDNPGRWDLSSLFIISNGAAPLSAGVRNQLRQALPNCFMNDTYGASESGAPATRLDDGQSRTAPKFDIGPDVMVVDDQHRPCPIGTPGLLARTGPIPIGYLGDPERTASTFVEIEGKRWSVPGDMAVVEEDGTITMLGRGSTTINSGGEKIHPEEVEGVLLDHDDVFDAGVVGTPHERWGQQVTALVQLREGADVTLEDLDRHVRKSLAGYKAPKSMFVVDHVPRTPIAKVDYPALEAMARELLGIGQEEDHTAG
jgi:acyl-CoA synthetase (AMP-forming)/AMP-acid ligase II